MTSKPSKPWLLGWAVFALAFLCLSNAEPGQAATVDLRIFTSSGSPVTGRHAGLLPLGSGNSSRFQRGRSPSLWGQLDSSGQIRFDNVSPGSYRIHIDLRGTRWIAPGAHPLRPEPIFTVTENDALLPLEVEVFEGVPVNLYLDLPVSISGFQARFVHPASGQQMLVPLYGDGRETVRVVPRGVWEVEVLPVEGFLLVGLWVNREPLAGTTAYLDLITDDLPPDLLFTFTAPVEIEGAVLALGTQRPSVQIQATLTEPGPWYEAAVARGVNIPDRIQIGLDDRDRYHAHLPPGRWRVEPVGENLVSSTPENVERTLASGDVLQADFTVEEEPGEESDALRVLVLAEHIESEEGTAGVVLEEGFSVWRGPAQGSLLVVPELAAGNYTAVAGHPETLEGRTTVSYDPDQRPERLPQIQLPAGGRIEVLGTDENGRRAAGLELSVERLDELPELTVQAPAFVDAKRGRILTTDMVGRGQATGFYAGLHRLTGHGSGERRASSIVEVRLLGERWQEALEIELDERVPLRVEIRERPAARITASLDCADAWRLPETTAVRLLDGWSLDPTAPIITHETFSLTGRNLDRLVLGPLEAGTYVLGLRPEGFDRWTWVYGAANPTKAEGLLIEPGHQANRRAFDLGAVTFECGPAVDLLPRVRTGHPFPPWREIRMTARSVSQVDEEKGLRDLDLVRRPRRLLVRDLNRGEQTLEITLEHPHFLPSHELLWELPMALERGMHREVDLVVDDLGGAIELRDAPAGTTAQVFREHHTVYSVPTRNDRLLLPSLLPGSWQLELCAEETCVDPLDMGAVEVRRGETTVLELTEKTN